VSKTLLLGLILFSSTLSAQDDLLSLLGDQQENQQVQSTFKATKVLNGQSVEIPSKGALLFIIEHRFGTINSGAYELWGLDQASMRMSFDYGLTDGFVFGVARSSFQKTYEASVKTRVLRQRKVGRAKVSLGTYHAAFINSLRWANPERENFFRSRVSYVHQVLIARKFNQAFSLQLTPTLVHRNLVQSNTMNNNYFAMGLGARYKISNRVSLNGEYFYQLNRPFEDFTNSLSLGFDIETGGHVFQLHLTNSQGMFERAFIGETLGKWSEGAIYFGFNISRVFQ